MEFLQNGFTLEIPEGCFPLSTDSIALSSFVKLPKSARVLDLGAGCGTLGMLLCAVCPDCTVTGIEIDPVAHAGALKNAAANQITDRYSSICGNLCDMESQVKPGYYHICVSNPPYFTAGPASKELPQARQEQTCTLDALFRIAGRSLRWGGDFFLVHKPERLAEICACGNRHNLEPKILQLLRHRKDGPVALVLVQCRKGGKPGLKWQEQYLFEADGTPSVYYQSLYH